MEDHRRDCERAKRRETQRRKEGQGEIELARSLIKGKTPRQGDIDDYKAAVVSWMQDLRGAYAGSIVRRTVNSVDKHGRPISGLDKYHEHPLILSLNEQECRD